MSNIESLVKVLKIIHFAMLMGMIVLGIAAWVVTEKGTVPLMPTEQDSIFFYAALMMASSAAIVGFLLQKRDKETIKEINEMEEKVVFYRSATIRHFAIIEGVALLNTIFFMITADIKILIVTVFMLLYFLTLQPGVVKVKQIFGVF